MAEEEKGSENGAVSLTKVLSGADGEPLRMSLDGNDPKDLTVREAILLSLLHGEGALRMANKPPLSDQEKLNCFMLARDVSSRERTGYTFSSEEVSLIKKLAAAKLFTEPFGALVEVLDPGALKRK